MFKRSLALLILGICMSAVTAHAEDTTSPQGTSSAKTEAVAADRQASQPGGATDASTANSPSEAYMAIHKAELAAKSYEDLLSLRAKESIARDKPVSAVERKMMFSLMQQFMVKDIRVTGQKIEGNKATVYAVPVNESKNEHTTGVITLILEDGKWKLDTEKWQSKMTAE
jgi:hypothetical protein